MVGEIINTGTNTVPGANLGSMYLINTQYNYPDGYLRVNAGEYKLVSRDAALAWRNAQTHWVIANFADVLPRKDIDSYPPLITLYKGALLQQTAPEDAAGWIEVTLHSGVKGYVKTELLRKRTDLARPEKVFDTTTLTEAQKDVIRNLIAADALSYTNSNYRWAGKTPLGLDCSGLASMAYMLNGIDTYRNSRVEPGSSTGTAAGSSFGTGGTKAIVGFPVALKHIDTPTNTSTTFSTSSTHTIASLAKAKPGDMLYWSGHQGIYIGNGEFTHSNGSSASNRRNSLIPNQVEPAITRTDLNTYGSIYTWGTAFPDEPEKIIVGRLALTRTGTRVFRIVARIDGYVPNRAEFYPCGVNASGNPLGIDGTTANPIVHNINTVANIRYMLFDTISTTSASAPSYTYPAGADGLIYRPAIKFFNETGYRPKGNTITSDVYVYPAALTVN
jgi:beta-lactamase class A